MNQQVHEHNRPECQVRMIRRFDAHNSDGKLYTIEVWTGFAFVRGPEPLQVDQSHLEYRTEEGDAVEPLGNGKYRVRSQPEVLLTTDDPQAL